MQSGRAFMDIVHYSVMREEAFSLLDPQESDSLFIDCTLGEGGIPSTFFPAANGSMVSGLMLMQVLWMLQKKGLNPTAAGQGFLMNGSMFFSGSILWEMNDPDLILFDLGISIFHYEKSGRGFSFQQGRTP